MALEPICQGTTNLYIQSVTSTYTIPTLHVITCTRSVRRDMTFSDSEGSERRVGPLGGDGSNLPCVGSRAHYSWYQRRICPWTRGVIGLVAQLVLARHEEPGPAWPAYLRAGIVVWCACIDEARLSPPAVWLAGFWARAAVSTLHECTYRIA